MSGVLLPLILVALMACLHDSAAQKCRTKGSVYDEKYENVRGPKCKFAPSNWGQINPGCRDLPANRPSPINIELGLCKAKSPALKDVVLGAGWLQKRKFTVKNNGHSLQADVQDVANNGGLTVSGGNLQGTYNCIQFHFHWGSKETIDSGIGSEHRLFSASGKVLATPLEVHIVCKDEKLSFSQAQNTPNAIAVLAGFLQPTDPSKILNGNPSAAIATVLSNMQQLITPRTRAAGTVELQMRHLLPDNLLRFVNYDGGLTTPGCNPVVQWHIFPDLLQIRKELVEKFTTAFFDAGKKQPMVNNFRPVLSRHGRELRCSFNI